MGAGNPFPTIEFQTAQLRDLPCLPQHKESAAVKNHVKMCCLQHHNGDKTAANKLFRYNTNELGGLFKSYNVNKIMQHRGLQWFGRVDSIGNTLYVGCVVETSWKEDTGKNENERENVRMQLVLVRVQWQALVLAVLNLRVLLPDLVN